MWVDVVGVGWVGVEMDVWVIVDMVFVEGFWEGLGIVVDEMMREIVCDGLRVLVVCVGDFVEVGGGRG